MRTLLLVCFLTFGSQVGAAALEWPPYFPSQHSARGPGGNWATSRFYWHQSLRRQAPLQFLLLVSVVFPGEWGIASSEFFVNKRGGMHHWVATSRDIRHSSGRDRQLSERGLRRIKELIPKLQVPVRRASGGRVIVSFVEDGKWITFMYSSDALPSVVTEIFGLLNFTDYGSAPQNF